MYVERIKIFTKSGSVLRVDATSDVIVSANNAASAAEFYVMPCLSIGQVNTLLADRCVSLMLVGNCSYFVRHTNYYLVVDPVSSPRVPSLFHTDASFLLHGDTFSPGFHALEPVALVGSFVQTTVDNRLKVSATDGTTAMQDSASFYLDTKSAYGF